MHLHLVIEPDILVYLETYKIQQYWESFQIFKFILKST